MKSKLTKVDLDRGLLRFYDNKVVSFQGLAIPFYQITPEMLLNLDAMSRKLLGAAVLAGQDRSSMKRVTTFDYFKNGKELPFAYFPLADFGSEQISVLGSGSFIYNRSRKDSLAKVKILTNTSFSNGVVQATSALAANYYLKLHADYPKDAVALYVYSADEAIDGYRSLGYELYDNADGGKENKMFLTKGRAEILRGFYSGQRNKLPQYN